MNLPAHSYILTDGTGGATVEAKRKQVICDGYAALAQRFPERITIVPQGSAMESVSMLLAQDINQRLLATRA